MAVTGAVVETEGVAIRPLVLSAVAAISGPGDENGTTEGTPDHPELDIAADRTRRASTTPATSVPITRAITMIQWREVRLARRGIRVMRDVRFDTLGKLLSFHGCVRVHRKPTSKYAVFGSLPTRLAARVVAILVFHEPPRISRCLPASYQASTHSITLPAMSVTP